MKTKERLRNPRPKPRGQSLVEFTLFLVLMLVLIAGAVDVGNALIVYTTLSDAAQEGANYGAIHPTDEAGIRAHVLDAAGNYLNQLDNVQVQVTLHDAACAGQRIVVRVSAEYHSIFPFTRMFLPSGRVPMTARSSNTILRSEEPSCP